MVCCRTPFRIRLGDDEEGPIIGRGELGVGWPTGWAARWSGGGTAPEGESGLG